MRMVAQSMVPARPSYLHVAYAAAIPLESQSLLMLCTAVVIAAAVLIYQVQNKVRRSYLCLTIAIALMASAMGVQSYRDAGERNETRTRIGLVRNRIAFTRYEGSVPGDIAGIRAKFKLSREQTRDHWGRDVRVSRTRADRTCAEYEVRSAGRDGRFRTDDDVRLTGMRYWHGGQRR